MEVILLGKIRGLGNLGDRVHVLPGYGRNYLVPTGKAVLANEENIKQFEAMHAELHKREEELLNQAKSRADSISTLQIVIPTAVSEEGKLYGSIGTKEIAEAVTKMGVTLEKSEVRLPNGAFRFPGEFDVELQLHSDIVIPIKISIVPQAK